MTPAWRFGQPLFEIRDAISVVARHEMTPVDDLTVRKRLIAKPVLTDRERSQQPQQDPKV